MQPYAWCMDGVSLKHGENRQLVALLDKTYTEARYGNLVISIAEVNALQLLVAALFHETEESLGRVIGDLGTRE